MTSLEIVNQALDSMKKFKSKIYKLCDSDIRKIKKDLNKYNNLLELIKNLFNEIDIGYNFDCDKEPAYEYEMYFNDNGGTDRCINEDLYMILLKLYQMVGDNHD